MPKRNTADLGAMYLLIGSFPTWRAPTRWEICDLPSCRHTAEDKGDALEVHGGFLTLVPRLGPTVGPLAPFSASLPVGWYFCPSIALCPSGASLFRTHVHTTSQDSPHQPVTIRFLAQCARLNLILCLALEHTTGSDAPMTQHQQHSMHASTAEAPGQCWRTHICSGVSGCMFWAFRFFESPVSARTTSRLRCTGLTLLTPAAAGWFWVNCSSEAL